VDQLHLELRLHVVDLVGDLLFEGHVAGHLLLLHLHLLLLHALHFSLLLTGGLLLRPLLSRLLLLSGLLLLSSLLLLNGLFQRVRSLKA
jgi:hypothetical protein